MGKSFISYQTFGCRLIQLSIIASTLYELDSPPSKVQHPVFNIVLGD